MRSTIIIYCRNQEGLIDKIPFGRFLEKNSNYSFCFVNDGSDDATITILDTIERHYKEQVKVIDSKKCMGYYHALQLGLRFVLKNNEFDYIGLLRSELSIELMDFGFLEKELINSTELVRVNNIYDFNGSRKKGVRGIVYKLLKKLEHSNS